jgi:FAD binding domain/Berberine and berberine like
MHASAVRDLDATFGGELVLPGDQGYDDARAVWNGMIDRRPALVARPADADDVATAIRFGRDHDLVLAVKGGGHSIPGFSTCDDGVVVDLSQMRGAQVDPERRIAQVNGGAHLGELDDAAQAAGLVCPVGVVSHTGVAGLTLGGGMGRLQRKFGLTIDNLLSVDLVTADGHFVRASEEENPELFWGVRGAGANFGVVTSFQFRLHPFDGTITFGSVVHPIERASELAELYRGLSESGPDDLWASFGLGLQAGRPVAQIGVLHCGSIQAAERDLAPLRSFGPPDLDSIAVRPYLEVQRMNDEPQAWGHRFYMKSGFLTSLPGEVVDVSIEAMSRVPEGADCGISLWSCGRAYSAVPEEATAFSGRDAAFWFSAEAMWEDAAKDESCRAWARTTMDEVMPFTSAGRYVNDVVESGEDVARSVYGDAKYERLVALKRAWDPENVFRLNQNIRPSL